MSKESEVTEYEQKRMQSKKVLGFYKKDSWQVIAVNNDKIFAVNSDKLVSVRLASESVGLKKLNKEIAKTISYIEKEEKFWKDCFGSGAIFGLEYLKNHLKLSKQVAKK